MISALNIINRLSAIEARYQLGVVAIGESWRQSSKKWRRRHPAES